MALHRTLPDWTAGELAAGLACYRRGEFWAAHEHWENIWRQSQGPEKSFLQGLIQLAGALHHHRRNNRRGAVALLQAALRRLEPCPEHFGGLWLSPLRQDLKNWLAALQADLGTDGAAILLPYPQIRPEIAGLQAAEPVP